MQMAEQMRVNGISTEIRLTTDGDMRWRDGSTEWCLTVESEVLGFAVEGSRLTVKAFLGEERVIPEISCGIGRVRGRGGKRVRKDFVLEFPRVELAMLWAERLQECIASLGRPRRLFILVNPFGGKKCARKVFDNEIKMLLEAAGISYTLQETKYQLHAQEIASKIDLSKCDGIVCVSGDGLLVEVVNGLLQRDDWKFAIKVPLGIIPAGTGNGMAKSLLDSVDENCSVSNAIFSVIRGHKRQLDVATVLQGETMFFSVLMLSWGLVADVDIESEKLRWMGSTRLNFYSFLRVINLRKYHGHVSFIPATGYEVYGKPLKQFDAFSNCNCGLHNQRHGNNVEVPQFGYRGAITCFRSLEWRSIEGPFILVWLHNVPWTSNNVKSAPEAKFSDGFLDLVIVKDCPKLSLISLFKKLNDGSHVKSPYVMYLKVKAFHLDPGHRIGDPSKGGIINSDGEVIARGKGTYQCDEREGLMMYGLPIQMTVDSGLATIFSPR